MGEIVKLISVTKPTLDALKRFNSRLEDNGDILDLVLERAFYPIMQEVFDTEGRGAWRKPPLSKVYAARKKARYGDKPIHQATGTLMRSLTQKGAPYNVTYNIDRNTRAVGTTLYYAEPVDNLRPIFVFNENDKQRMADVYIDELTKEIKKLGLI